MAKEKTPLVDPEPEEGPEDAPAAVEPTEGKGKAKESTPAVGYHPPVVADKDLTASAVSADDPFAVPDK